MEPCVSISASPTSSVTQEDVLCQVKRYFGYKSLRPFQFEAIQAILSSTDCLLILPTGGGKSMAYQVPPLIKKDCFTVVISPLIALATEQVDKCQDANIDAQAWNSNVSDLRKANIVKDIVAVPPSIQLLFTTPESLLTPTLKGALKEALQAGTICSFAIDEAHCISQWGHDFRPAYCRLASLKTDYPGVPIAAFTASCTPEVERAIIQSLNLCDVSLFKASFNRPNISYEVRYKRLISRGKGKPQHIVKDLLKFLKDRNGQAGIIYARLRSTCDWLTKVLGSHDLDVRCYHAGRDAADRQRVQSEWSEGYIDIVVATIAFGMGMDRADVRWVVHWDVPCTVDGFYQESGRAGRDGLPSHSLLYMSRKDFQAAQNMKAGISNNDMMQYAFEPGCRRRKILQYFGESGCGTCKESKSELCDYCKSAASVSKQLQSLEEEHAVGRVGDNATCEEATSATDESSADTNSNQVSPRQISEGKAKRPVGSNGSSPSAWVPASKFQVPSRKRIQETATVGSKNLALQSASERRFGNQIDNVTDRRVSEHDFKAHHSDWKKAKRRKVGPEPPPPSAKQAIKPEWVRILEEDADVDDDVARLLDGTGGDPEKIRSKMIIELQQRAIERHDGGSERPPRVIFQELDTFNCWLWFEMYAPPSERERGLLSDVLRSWYVVGKLGGYNSQNLQVSENASDDQSYFEYDVSAAEDSMGSFLHNMETLEYRDKLARINLDLGTCDELALDVLLNMLFGLSKEVLGIKRIYVGGSLPSWPLQEEASEELPKVSTNPMTLPHGIDEELEVLDDLDKAIEGQDNLDDALNDAEDMNLYSKKEFQRRYPNRSPD